MARALFMINALLGAIATEGGVFPNAWNKFVPRPIYTPPHPNMWNEKTWPREFPLSMHEMSFLLPHLLKDGRGKLDVYFTRVYNPVWTNPDGFSWIEALTDENLIGCHVALTPVWNETSYFADYILPMGLGPERHDLHSYETHDSQWLGFRQPVMKVARQREGDNITDTRQVNPGEFGENEFWMELTWRIDADGSLGFVSMVDRSNNGHTSGVDEYYGGFENSVPGLPEQAALKVSRRLNSERMVRSRLRKRWSRSMKNPCPKRSSTTSMKIPSRSLRALVNRCLQHRAVPSTDGDGNGRRLAGVRAMARFAGVSHSRPAS